MIKFLEKRSLAVLQVDDVRPHSPISSLHARMTGCLVNESKFSNSALPPLSPFRDLDGSSSPPDIIDVILSLDTALKPPDK